jgi:hypothetical protein
MKLPDNMKYLKWFFGSLLSLLSTLHLNGQSVENLEKAIEMLGKVSQTYDSGQVAFDIRYTYANEGQPQILLDSLSGNIIMSEGKCFSRLRNTVFLTNQRYSIAVFNEDKLIHVSRPVSKDAMGISPMQVISASIRQAGVKSCVITNKKEASQIRFMFSPEKAYRYMEITLDTRNWRIQQLSYVVKSELALEASEQPGKVYEPYALVKAFFSHYRTDDADPAIFDEKQFFTRTATALVPASAYEDYEVFIGSPNL